MAEIPESVKAVDRLVAEHLADPEKWIELSFSENGEVFDLSFMPEEPGVWGDEAVAGYVNIGSRGFDLDSMDVPDFGEESVAKVKKFVSEIVWEFGRG